MEKYGIIRGKLNEPYANIGVCITGDSCNLIGISYPGIIVLYRVFDGSYIHYFSKGVTLDILATHYLISDLTFFEFDEEAWKVDGHDGSLIKRFTAANGRAALSHASNRDYKKLLLYYAGLTNDIVANGYFRVNEIILATCGGANIPKDIMTASIVSSKYIKEGVMISKEYRNAYPYPTPESIKTETTSNMKSLTDAFTELTIENKLYQTYIMNLGRNSKIIVPDVNLYTELIRNGTIPEEDKLKLASVLSPLIHGEDVVDQLIESKKMKSDEFDYSSFTETLVDDFEIIRSGIATMMNGFTDEKIPVVHISDMITSFNNLADKVGIPRLDTTTKGEIHSSVGALIVAGTNGFEPAEISVNLSCGNVVILSTKAPDLSQFSYFELIEILRYLMSVKSFDSRFNSLTSQITQELAIKTKLRNTF